eukprot:TRINITY_DN3809_c0_g1_i3.p1 TRINITY_DN3809_c0_g1~~TRINITY_DN3809_c0_g1_i3.p1  ORF type:complete len:591 (+),score=154.47 TRINITY_DN3809_c0_g1_i3:89-1774(+)
MASFCPRAAEAAAVEPAATATTAPPAGADTAPPAPDAAPPPAGGDAAAGWGAAPYSPARSGGSASLGATAPSPGQHGAAASVLRPLDFQSDSGRSTPASAAGHGARRQSFLRSHTSRGAAAGAAESPWRKVFDGVLPVSHLGPRQGWPPAPPPDRPPAGDPAALDLGVVQVGSASAVRSSASFCASGEREMRDALGASGAPPCPTHQSIFGGSIGACGAASPAAPVGGLSASGSAASPTAAELAQAGSPPTSYGVQPAGLGLGAKVTRVRSAEQRAEEAAASRARAGAAEYALPLTQDGLPVIAHAARQGREALQVVEENGLNIRRLHDANQQLKEQAACAADRHQLKRQLERASAELRAKEAMIAELRRDCESAATAQQQGAADAAELLDHTRWLLHRAQTRADTAEARQGELQALVAGLEGELERERTALQQRDTAQRESQDAIRRQLAERDRQLADRDLELREEREARQRLQAAYSQLEHQGAVRLQQATTEATRAQQQAHAAQGEVLRLSQDIQNAAALHELQLRLARTEQLQMRLDLGLDQVAAAISAQTQSARPF